LGYQIHFDFLKGLHLKMPEVYLILAKLPDEEKVG
jgi:hypothetical protein